MSEVLPGKKIKIYGVLTKYNYKLGVCVYMGTKVNCRRFIKQAIQKGSVPGFLVIVGPVKYI